MNPSISIRRASLTALPGIALALLLVGCGGGGGSGAVQTARSYSFASGGQTFAMSVDSSGRFTVFARDAAALPGGAGGQGTFAGVGAFSAGSDDGTVQFNGTVAGDGSSATGTVKSNGQALFAFTATSLSTRSTASGLAGTYTGASGSDTVLLTVDAATSHATLWARIGGATGGELLAVAGNGTLSSSDGGTAGQLTLNAGVYTLQITRLNGQSLSAQFTLTRITRAKWTFLVFLNAANNLEEFGPLNVNQMEKVGSTGDVNIVVQWKQARCSDCGTPDWVSTRRYFVTKDNDTSTVHSQLVQDLGPNVDMGNWQTLRDFIVWTQQHYPADHYALVIWDHGAGWLQTRGNRLHVPPRAVSIDDSTNHEIETWQLPQALDVTPKMDMVIFDASLMQMVEVLYEMRNSTAWVVGSEESPPGEGYPYDTFLSDLVQNPNMSASQFGAQIVSRTLEFYGPSGNNTQSEVDMSKMQNMADKLNTFADTLLAHVADSKTAMQDARNNAQNYAYPENKDLWDYAAIIQAETAAADLKSAAAGVQQAIAAAVVAERHGSINGKSHGLAVYVPDPANFDPRYANLALARVTDWPRWLQNQP
jgi:hypothetical protein